MQSNTQKTYEQDIHVVRMSRCLYYTSGDYYIIGYTFIDETGIKSPLIIYTWLLIYSVTRKHALRREGQWPLPGSWCRGCMAGTVRHRSAQQPVPQHDAESTPAHLTPSNREAQPTNGGQSDASGRGHSILHATTNTDRHERYSNTGEGGGGGWGGGVITCPADPMMPSPATSSNPSSI